MNPAKEHGQRCRQGFIGVAFPPDRIPEVKAAANAHGLTVSAWARMTIFQRLDEIKKQQAAG